MSEVVADQNRNKRKRKKTFLRNARKYAKKGQYGRGSQLDADTYQYFIRIMEAYREGFDNEEDKSIFVNNVFEQTENNEVNYSCNQVGCRVIEMLVPFANDAALERYMATLGSDLRPLCSDRFASHVIEALLTQTCSRSLTDSTEASFKVNCKKFTLKIGKFLLNNLEDYMWDTYGNHIIRSVFVNLAQLPKSETNKKDDSQGIKTIEINAEVPQDYADVVVDYGERLISWPQFKDLPYTEITSGLLQILLLALSKLDPKLLSKYLKKLLNESFLSETPPENTEDPNKLPQVFTSKPAMMLLETVMQTAKPKLLIKIRADYFMGKMASLAKTRSTNFAVQKLLTYCVDKTEFEAMFDELSDSFEDIISAGHTGIILAVAQMCKRLATKQGSFLQILIGALHCFEPEDRQNSFIICLCKFVTFENVENAAIVDLDKEKLNLHGTLILQLLLDFNKPIKIVTAILSLESDVVRKLFSNSMGSHIVDSYTKSQFVGEKSRERLIRKLQGQYQELAVSKYGSRSFEALWNVCSVKWKLNVMDELMYKDSLWSNSEFGRIIASKINISLYKRNKEEWKNGLNKTSKVKELTDLLK